MIMIPVTATRTGQQLMEETCLKDQASHSSLQLGKLVRHYRRCSSLHLAKSAQVQTLPIFARNPTWSFLAPTGLALHCVLILLWGSFIPSTKKCVVLILAPQCDLMLVNFPP